MRITKQLEKEIKVLMDDYWDSYMTGDLKHWGKYLVNDYRNIGGTKEEIWNSKKEILDYTHAIIDQMMGQAEIRNKTMQIIPYDPYIMVHEFMDLYIKVSGKWTFYGKFRLSSLIQKTTKGWKVLHQHGSYPDSKTKAGEAFAFDEIKAENIKLKDAVKRRTIELEEKNRELEIETALEKVRAVAMGMKEPADMLTVCKTISLQLQSLGVKEIRNVQTAIINEIKGTYLNYEYYAKHKKLLTTEVDFKNHKIQKKFAGQMLTGAEELFTETLKGKKLKDWYAYQQTTNQFADRYLEKAESLNYYWYSLGPVALGISTYISLTEDQINLFKRFRNVFELAYRRFIDIELAISQAKEARIETALERVRAVAMAMQHPEDLTAICEVLYKELLSLGFTAMRNAMINIHNDANESFVNYDYSDEMGKSINSLFYNIHPVIEKQIKQIRIANDAFSETVFEGNDLKEWKKFRKRVGEKDDPRINKSKALYYYFYSIGTGSIGISTFNPVKAEPLDLLKRFRNVLNLAYQRYTDISLALEQAQEAQIQLALERVRARTMAMQHSEELAETVTVMFKQFKALGEAPERMAIEIVNEKEKVFEIWATQHGGSQLNLLIKISLDEPHVMQKMYKAWKEQTKSITIDLQGNELDEYFKFLKKAGLPVQQKIFGKRRVQNVATFSKGILTIITPEPRPQETIVLLERFAAVFDGTYTRFLDLQKAEAQAREAQIEVSLERVRSRAMAMHKTGELLDAAELVYKELTSLGITSMAVSYAFVNEQEKNALYYGINPVDSKIPPVPFVFPHTKTDVMRSILSSWKKQEAFKMIELDEKATLEHQTWVGEHIQTTFAKNNIPFSVKAFLEVSPQTAVIYTFHFTQGYIFIIGEERLSVMQEEMLLRFTKVFEMTYRRFLDLQKAEAQAREAQIELGLERVRARSMAMQKSDELGEVVTVLLEKLQSLGFVIDEGAAAHINIFADGTKDLVQWSAAPHQSKPVCLKVPYTDNLLLTDFFEAREKGLNFFAKTYSFEEKNEWFNYAFEHSDFKYLPDSLKQVLLESENYSHWIAIEKNSAIVINSVSGNILSENQIEIQKRFGRVFEQAYVRFLDLQKAEAQTREVQINLAVERVRARALAMFKSEEILEVVFKLKEEIMSLAIPGVAAATIHLKEKNGMHRMWDLSSFEQDGENMHLPLDISYKLDETHPDLYIRKIWKNSEKYFLVKQDRNDLKITTNWLREHKQKEADEAEQFLNSIDFNYLYHPTIQLNNGRMSIDLLDETPPAEMETILTKMGAAFDLAYKRFEDLKNSEAQLREAKIEAALERVRSRSMGMQKSEELKEVIQVVYEQFVHLNIHIEHTGFVVDYKAKGDWHFWIADKNEVPAEITVPYFDSVWGICFNEAKEKGMDFFATHLNFEEKNRFYTDLLKHIPGLTEEAKEFYFSCPGLGASTVLLENVGLYIENFSGIPYSDEENAILMRFGKVFQQTYTRFLDLQKAEAQARESHIEAALERVRSQSMGMQTSQDLSNVTTAMFEQLRILGGELYATGIVFCDKHENHVEQWHSVPGAGMLSPFIVPVNLDYIHQYRYEQWKRGTELFSVQIPEDFIAQHFDAMFNLPTVKAVLEDFAAKNIPMPETPSWEIDYGASFKHGYILVSALQPFKEAAILPRFAKVFEQTYTRFLDLQKAEAQAREAKIEAALERVRAKAMAMHHSEELSEVLTVLIDQFDILGISPVCAHISLIDLENNTFTYRETGRAGQRSMAEQILDLGAINIRMEAIEKWKSSDPLSIHTPYYPKEVLPKLWEMFNEIHAAQPEEAKIFPEDYPDGVYVTEGNCKFGYIGFHHSRKATKEEEDIVLKFATEFGRLYQRFLDLQKAEAQVREAQIELGLERVRARAMAMRNSDELAELVDTVFKELSKLDFALNWCIINIIDEVSMANTVWAANPDIDKAPESYYMKFEDYPYHHAMIKDWRERKSKSVYTLEGQEKQIYDDYLFSETEFKRTPEIAQVASKAMSKYVCSFSFSNFGGLQTVGEKPLSEESLNILGRFGKVFDLTYTRFNDLQKAEAQAREAEIELALERIRARTMAMQKSDELPEAANLLFLQVQALGLPAWSAGYCIWDEDKKGVTLWMSSEGVIQPPARAPLTEDPSFIHMREAYERGESFFVEEIGGDELVTHYRYMRTLPVVGEILDSIIEAGHPLPTFQIFHLAYFSQGFLLFITYEPVPEAHEIFRRFGKVFDQTYTRFLDLQKAEAQGREAQIELALERVRARTMAMQKSDELADAAQLLYQEFGTLGINTFSCGYMFIDEVKKTQTGWVVLPDGVLLPDFIVFPLTGDHVLDSRYKDWKEKKPLHIYEIQGEVNREHHRFLADYVPPFVVQDIFSKMPDRIVFHCSNFSDGYLLILATELFSPEEQQTIIRFAKVFEMTYRRFLDLKHAEAQAREAKIEYALEKVRSRTMAMQKSEELRETSQILFQQMKELGEPVEQLTIGIVKETENVVEVFATVQGSQLQQSFRHSIDEPTVMNKIYRGWKAQQKSLLVELNSDEIQVYNRYRNELVKSEMFSTKVSKDERRILYAAYFSKGMLALGSNTPLSEESHRLLERFAGVFDGTYTRFLDLEKAEAQAREATIEVALERVRAKAMAMHKSDDLAEAVATVFDELDRLNLGILRCGIGIINKENRSVDYWATSVSDGDSAVQVAGDESMDNHPLLKGAFDAWLRREDFSYILEGEDLAAYYKKMAATAVPLPESQLILSGDPAARQYYQVVTFEQGGLFAFKETEFSSEAKSVMKRFAGVFNLTYKRFLDLQKAEAQAKEAQIETSLERLRSKTMAMHSSQDVADTVASLFAELTKLGIETIRCGIGIMQETKEMEVWTAKPGEDGKADLIIGRMDMTVHPMLQGAYKGWSEKKESYTYELKDDDLVDYFTAINNLPGYPVQYEIASLPRHIFHNEFYFPDGTLFVFSQQQLPDETRKIFKRFAGVFGQTYRRYLDLQKAEAQAKEAKIEASLERVRGKAMAMHNSQDLADTIGVFYKELQSFSITPRRCGVGLLNKENKAGELFTWNTTEQGESLELVGKMRMEGHPVLENIYNGWLSQIDYYPILRGNEIKEYYQLIRPQIGFPDYPNDAVQYGYFFFFNEGGVYAWSEKEMNEDELQIYRRFTSVLSLTYKRYKDLKHAEAQTKEAQVEAALERVRSRTLAMHKSDELAETAAEVFKQLIGLGIEPNRLYIGIVKDESGDMEMWATDEDGTQVGQKFMFNKNENASVKKLYDGWAAKEKSVIVDMEGKELEDYLHYLNEVMHIPFKGGLTQKRRVQSVAYFSKGFIGMASSDGQGSDTLQLLERFAGVFNLTFTRFSDLKIAEAHAEQAEQDLIKLQTEKRRAEDALRELQATQTQLIQSEKMASLGELTAGIAHEIQNPLNFVNNFSEVSKELLDEMKTELESGNTEEAKEIAEDVIQNLEKINHHGKRADAIVKGMLQHSRSSSGAKEPTDINALCDEYLRLSYHGLRAKDKSFNASFKTDFDVHIGKINVLPQDLGRVILNLLTNAFYVVNEKKKLNIPGYEPTITVSTKLVIPPSGGQKGVEISVGDNGNGIPPKVLDKIFQPFFTTKPTGQGTGLGLSLSYDIVTKGHGGELKVETREGEGSVFIIQLPTN